MMGEMIGMKRSPAPILVVDNYDSFTYNLVQHLGELGAECRVVRNDAASCEELLRPIPAAVVISPGPGTPADTGICRDLVRVLDGRAPLLGVCLGHQVLAEVFGGRIIPAKTIMHGKASDVHHKGNGVFANLANPFSAMRYHSLSADPASLPECLEANAWTLNRNGAQEEIMGLRHRSLPYHGVQFHPESIMTEPGMEMLKTFLSQAGVPAL